jgi:hypothetical protein
MANTAYGRQALAFWDTHRLLYDWNHELVRQKLSERCGSEAEEDLNRVGAEITGDADFDYEDLYAGDDDTARKLIDALGDEVIYISVESDDPEGDERLVLQLFQMQMEETGYSGSGTDMEFLLEFAKKLGRTYEEYDENVMFFAAMRLTEKGLLVKEEGRTDYMGNVGFFLPRSVKVEVDAALCESCREWFGDNFTRTGKLHDFCAKRLRRALTEAMSDEPHSADGI